jgi:hypothetical protein
MIDISRSTAFHHHCNEVAEKDVAEASLRKTSRFASLMAQEKWEHYNATV